GLPRRPRPPRRVLHPGGRQGRREGPPAGPPLRRRRRRRRRGQHQQPRRGSPRLAPQRCPAAPGVAQPRRGGDEVTITIPDSPAALAETLNDSEKMKELWASKEKLGEFIEGYAQAVDKADRGEMKAEAREQMQLVLAEY